MASGSEKSEAPHGPPFRREGGRVILSLHVQPGAKRTEWAGLYGGRALRLRVAAPPVDGKANRACQRFLARTFGVSPAQVSIVRGQSGRDKTVTVESVAPDRWRAFRELWPAS